MTGRVAQGSSALPSFLLFVEQAVQKVREEDEISEKVSSPPKFSWNSRSIIFIDSGHKSRLKKLQEAMWGLEREELEKEKVNATAPESRLMKDSRKVIQPSYNGQIAAGKKEQVIVGPDVSQNGPDHDELRPLVEQQERNLGFCLKKAVPMLGTYPMIIWNMLNFGG